MNPVIQAQGLTRIYTQGEIEVHALRGVDLRVHSGELTALVGPSGSGKSTLLNLIGCLDRPTAGTLEVDGQDISPFSRTAAAQFRLERLGFVFQAYNLLPVLTAYENAEYTLLLRGLNPRERREIVEPLMERVGLADMMNRRPHELSGGQQQRVAVVRALAAKPCLILADEPTANLDTATTGGMLDLLVELNENDGMTFLLASHDKRVVERARRVVHLEDGLICADERRDS